MIPNVENSNVSRQEFIDLLCRITKTDEEMTTTMEQEITIIYDNSTVEEGKIITLDDEVEDGEITESQGSDVCVNQCFIQVFSSGNGGGGGDAG